MPPHGAPGDKGEALKAVESRSPGEHTDSLSIQEQSKTIYSTGSSTRTLGSRIESTVLYILLQGINKGSVQITGKRLDSRTNDSHHTGVCNNFGFNDLEADIIEYVTHLAKTKQYHSFESWPL